MTTWSRSADARIEFVCYPVQPGDTAGDLALRLTGSADNRHERWFRIVDTDGLRVVPKPMYGHILPGWKACIPEAPAGASFAQSHVADRQAAIAPAFMRWAAPMLPLLTALLAWLVVMRDLGEREAVLNVMKRFGERFVVEFEEPLYQEPAARRAAIPLASGVEGRADRPVRSRLRFAPSRNRLEILLAPHEGRSYPNLSDHRRNLEYDVERVLDLLGDAPFVAGRLRAEGRWVVVPFHVKAGRRSLRRWSSGPQRM